MKSAFLATTALALGALPAAAAAQDHSQHHGHDMSQMPTPPPQTPAPPPAPQPAPAPMPHDHSEMDHDENADTYETAMAECTKAGSSRETCMLELECMTASCGTVPTSKGYVSGSGTSRLPGKEGGMHGLMTMAGDWHLMAHGFVQTAYTDHDGPRGDEKFYVTNMAMLSASRDFAGGKFGVRSMLSLEPAMNPRGYPNLFATGETAYGEPLVDRQHPHDLFMELAARLDIDVADNASLFLYGGPVGEPAIGPSAFMHRSSARYNPEPPITHHWFDSTHITYGVVTAGLSTPKFQLETSAFRGREPDEQRWNIETPKLDSWAVRGTWNPTPNWSTQISTAQLKAPEAAHGGNEQRTTASVHYANGRSLSVMAAFSAKDRKPGPTLTAWLAEANYDLDTHHTVFARYENVKNDELFPDHAHPLHDQPFRVAKMQAGYAYRLPVSDKLELALGGSLAAYGKPAALDAFYGKNPLGYTLFAKLSLGH